MEEVIKKAEEKGIDVIDVLLRELQKEDPEESLKLRIHLADKFLSEAKSYLEKNDIVQASEKGYNAGEEIVKALSEKYKTREYEQYTKEGRWYTYSLFSSAISLSKVLGDWVLDGWRNAYDLHVWGFHEGKLDVEKVKYLLGKVEEFVNKVKSVLKVEGLSK
ncbi:PaREP1 family protein [Sulfurisphaera javensis]|uniref:PaREP1 family protein n=1 Tax=Sulfurisphaera javensis TaxID=2049879 RepID=A0AAT9GV02_9CREN